MYTGIKKIVYEHILPVAGMITAHRDRIPVIYYHDVVPGEGSTFMRTNRDVFLQQMDWLKKEGYQTLLFSEPDKDLKKQSNEKKVLIAFDDGWLSNYTIVFPEMMKRGMKFNIFIANKYINQGGQFLDWNMLFAMVVSGIVGVGAHTYNHIDSKLIKTDEIFSNEITAANEEIEKELGFVPTDFCFPYGYYDEQIVNRLAEEQTYQRLYTSNTIEPVCLNDCVIIGRTGISTDDSIKVFRHKVRDHYRVMKYYSRMVGAGELEFHA